MCGSPGSSVQPWAPCVPAWVINQFLWFSASHTWPEPAHNGLKPLSHLLPWSSSLSPAISRVAQGEVAACPLFLTSCGLFIIYSHSLEDFALPYRNLFHKPHTPLYILLICHLPKLLSSPGNVWGTCMPSSRLCMCCCDSSVFLFRNPSFSLTIAF